MFTGSALKKKVTSFSGDHFPVVRKGYDRAAVEQYLWVIEALIRGGDEVDIDELVNKSFPVARKGYDRPTVQRHLGKIAESLAPELRGVVPTPLAA